MNKGLNLKVFKDFKVAIVRKRTNKSSFTDVVSRKILKTDRIQGPFGDSQKNNYILHIF